MRAGNLPGIHLHRGLGLSGLCPSRLSPLYQPPQPYLSTPPQVCVRASVHVCVCVCACLRACVRACVCFSVSALTTIPSVVCVSALPPRVLSVCVMTGSSL